MTRAERALRRSRNTAGLALEREWAAMRSAPRLCPAHCCDRLLGMGAVGAPCRGRLRRRFMRSPRCRGDDLFPVPYEDILEPEQLADYERSPIRIGGLYFFRFCNREWHMG